MTTKPKWEIKRKCYLCYCGFYFLNHDNFTEHLQDTKRWRKKHFAMDYNNLPSGFTIYEVEKEERKMEYVKVLVSTRKLQHALYLCRRKAYYKCNHAFGGFSIKNTILGKVTCKNCIAKIVKTGE